MSVSGCITEKSVERLPICSISPNPAQPRTAFCNESINSLAESISQHGLLSPLLVRRISAGRYELIAGERRLRALKLLGRTHADALVISAYDPQSAVMALIENIQREQLHFLDEAAACRAIIGSQHITQEELAHKLGKSPSALANRLRLTKLCPQVRSFIMTTDLTERHARALLAVSDPDEQLSLAKNAHRHKYTVRRLEQLIAHRAEASKAPVRCAARDHRLYINAVLDTVEKLRSMGAAADSSVCETDVGTEIRILLKKHM